MNYLVAVYGFKVNQSELDDLLLASFLEKNEIFRLHFNRIYPKSKLKFQHSNIQNEPCSRCQLYCKCTLYTECCDVIRLLLDSEVVTWCFIVDTWNSQWKFSSGSLPGAGAGVSDLVSDLLYICLCNMSSQWETHPQPLPGQRPSDCRRLFYPRWRCRRGRGTQGRTSGTDGPWRPPSGAPSSGQRAGAPGSAAPSGWACSQRPWSSGRPGWGHCLVWPLAREGPDGFN